MVFGPIIKRGKMIIIINCFIFIFCVCSSNAIDFNTCPSPPVMKDFELTKYLGTWYEIERNYNPAETSKHTCATVVVSQIASKDYNVMFNATWKYRGNDRRLIVNGKYNANDEPAKLKIKPIPYFPRQNYWVMETDYENYAIVWSCAEFFLNHYQLVWIFSRERIMRPEIRIKAYNKIQELGFKLEDLIVVPHHNC